LGIDTLTDNILLLHIFFYSSEALSRTFCQPIF